MKPEESEKVKWSRTIRRLLVVAVLLAIFLILVPLATLPLFEHTRDARYDIVSFDTQKWVTRDGMYSVTFQELPTGVVCFGGTQTFMRLTLKELDGVDGGRYTVTFNPGSWQEVTTILIGPWETRIYDSRGWCPSDWSSPKYTFAPLPPRFTSQYISGDTSQWNNTVWELRGALTLREQEGIGGAYAVHFVTSSGAGTTVTKDLTPNGVATFQASITVPSPSVSMQYEVNAPKVTYKSGLFG